VKFIRLSIIPALSLGLAFQASAQQTTAASAAAETKYCNTLAQTYRSTSPALLLPSVSDAYLLGSCDTDARGAIVALKKKLADKHVDVPQDPALTSKVGQ
jgi:hypothetical protein